jgi:DeoR/GlpR family transcriptional regulator of sugar metabolism
MTKTEIRTAKLLEMLQIEKRVDVKTVAHALEISEATVRRLFAQLEEDGDVIRVHGGVQLAPQIGYDYSYRVSASHKSREKTFIGNAAAEVVKSDESLFLDSGTTVLKLAETLSVKIQTGALENIVVVTNSLTNIETLAKWCKVILIGGEVRLPRRDVCGTIAEKVLMMFHVDRAFFGADAISLEGGFMATDERTSKMNEIVLQQADNAYVLTDSGKFNKTSFISYATLDAVGAIFTDDGIEQETLDAFTNAGAHIEIVRF